MTGAAAVAVCALLASPTVAPAQQASLDPADSALILRILVAEDSRDTTAVALQSGREHPDARIRRLAGRALDRIVDSTFANRSRYDSLSAPPHWPDPEWLARFRDLPAQGASCQAIATAFHDPAWQVRFRAADVATASCSDENTVTETLLEWVNNTDVGHGQRIALHAAAQALPALSRLKIAGIDSVVNRFSRSRLVPLRRSAALAARSANRADVLRRLAIDTNPNVRETAIEELSKATGLANDRLYLAALRSSHAQVVRAAALALVGTTDRTVVSAANAAFRRWVARNDASARDARLALLAVAGRPASDDVAPRDPHLVPAEAVALALGTDIRLRVTMTPASGGGTFVVKLRGDVAPITAARILELVQRGYYDGLTWQRVEPGFVVQGGSPGSNEYVGYHHYFRDELGTVPHRRGTVGMSTRGHDTGDGQWFINVADNLRLGRGYTVFGEVVEGMDVIDGVMPGDLIASIERL